MVVSANLGSLAWDGVDGFVIPICDVEAVKERIEYLYRNEDEREQIACAGQRRTQAQHTYIHRGQTILDTILAPTFRRLSPMRKASSRERLAARCEVYTHLHILDAVLDEARSAGYNALRRARLAGPSLLRRLLS